MEGWCIGLGGGGRSSGKTAGGNWSGEGVKTGGSYTPLSAVRYVAPRTPTPPRALIWVGPSGGQSRFFFSGFTFCFLFFFSASILIRKCIYIYGIKK